MSKEYVFPDVLSGGGNSREGSLTKRELFAAFAMAGLLAGRYATPGHEAVTVQDARAYADALLVELRKTKDPTT